MRTVHQEEVLSVAYCRKTNKQTCFLKLLHMLQTNLLLHYYFPLKFEIVWLEKILYLPGVLNP